MYRNKCQNYVESEDIIKFMQVLKPNKLIFLFLLICMSCLCKSLVINAQEMERTIKEEELQKLFHIKGKEQISFGAGLVKNGWNADATYGRYLSKTLLLSTDFVYEKLKISLTTVNSYYFSPELAYVILKISGRCFLNVKAGIIIGNETTHNQVLVNQNFENIVFGELAGIKFEYFLSPGFSVNIEPEQRFINNSNIGSLSWNAIVNLSYNF